VTVRSQNEKGAVMAISEELLVSIQIDTKGAQSGVSKLTGSIKGMGKALDSTEKELKGIQSQLGKVAIAFTGVNQAMELTRKITSSIGSVIDSTIGNFSDFEASMRGVSKTTGLARDETLDLANELQDLSEVIPVGTDELLGLAEAAGQLGVKGSDNLSNFAETLAKLGRSSDIAGEDAARQLARLLNVTNESIDGVDELASVIVALGNNFAATESEIVRVASEVGRSTAVFGLSSDQIVAVSTALKAMGVQAQLGGSAVGRAFREIDNAIRTGGEALQSLTALTGKSGEELKKQFGEDAVGVFKLFIKGLNDVQKRGGSTATALDALNLRGDEIAKTLPPLAQGYNELARALDLAGKEAKNATALNEEAAEAFDSVNADAKIFTNSLKSLGIEIGQILAPVARSILQSLNSLLQSLRDLAEQVQKIDFNDLAISIRNVGAAIAVVGMGAFVLEIKSAIAAVGGLSAAITAMGGLSGILIQLKAFFAGIAVSAKAAAWAVAKMSATIVAIGGAAAAVDILIRNFSKLSELIDLIGDSLELLGIKLIENVGNKIQLAVAKGFYSVIEALNKIEVGGFKLIDDSNLINAQKNMSNIFDRMIKDNKRVLELQESIASKSNDVDFGFAGQLYGMFKSTNEEANELEKILEKTKKQVIQISEQVKLTADQMKILNDLIFENKSLSNEIEMFNSTQYEVLQLQLSTELEKIKAKEEQLRIEGNLVPVIQEQINKQKELIKLRNEMKGFEIARQDVSDIFGEGIANLAVDFSKAFNNGMKSGIDVSFLNNLPIGEGLKDKAEEAVKIINLGLKDLKISPEGLSDFANMFKDIKGFMTGSAKFVGSSFEAGVKYLDKSLGTSFSSGASQITEGMVAGASAVGSILDNVVKGVLNLFDPSFISAMADSINNMINNLPQMLSEAFSSLSEAITSMLQNLPDFVNKLFDIVGDGLQNIISKMPEIISGLAQSLSTFIDRLPEITGMLLEALPDIIDDLLSKLPDIITKLFEAIPEIIAQILDALPDILVSIMERLPDIIEAIIEGLLEASGKIVASFIDFLIGGGLEKIVKAFIKMIPRIAAALVRGFLNGIKKGVQAIFGGFKIPVSKELEELPNKIQNGVSNLAKNIARETSNVFKVLDLNEAAKGLGGDGGGMGDGIKDAFRYGGQYIEGYLKKAYMWVRDKIWKPIEKSIRKVWSWVKEKILDPFLDMLGSVWQFINEKILIPLTESLHEVFSWIGDKILTPFIDGVGAVFNFINDKIFSPFLERLNHAWQTVYNFFGNLSGYISNAFQSVFNQFGNLGTKISDGFKAGLNTIGQFFTNLGSNIWNGLKTGLDTLGSFFTNLFDRLNPSNLFERIFKVDYKGKGTVESALNIDVPFLKFNQGGSVPGKASVAGDSPLNDRILALLSPGEEVIPRSVMNDPVKASIVKQVVNGDLKAVGLFGGTLGKILKGDVKGAVEDVSNVSVEQAQEELGNVADVLSEPWKQVKEKVFNQMILKMLDQNKFHNGGPVGFYKGGEVPATLQTGEFVMNRGATSGIGLPMLNQMNQSGKIPSTSNYNFDVEIKIDASAQSLDENFVRNRLIPSIKDEFKRSSLRGEFLMSEKGIRA